MKKRSSISKKLYCPVMALLYLFAVCSNNLHAVNDSKPGEVPVAANDSQQSSQVCITYNKGLVETATAGILQAQTITGSEQTQTVETGSTVTLTDMGVNEPGFVFMGWHTMKMPLLNSLMMQTIVKSVGTFYATGDPLTLSEDMTLYAVWAYDKDNIGYPDFGKRRVKPTLNGVRLQNGMAVQNGGISFRSGDSDLWDNTFDLKAFHDSIYYVGCTYNMDTENHLYESLISLDPRYCFNERIASPNIPMNLIIEYGGVLTDGCMIGGQAQQALDTIQITAAMVANGFTVDSLIDIDPFRFNSITEDGQGILKMYFNDPLTDSFPNITDFSPAAAQAWGKPFMDPETGILTDTFTIKFNIYNKPEFKTKQIDQQVDSLGYLNLELVSGTPLNYMMRRIDGFSWQPATAPLSKEEQAYIGDNVSILLREMDKVIGYQMFQKEYYFTDQFNPIAHPAEFFHFKMEYVYAYNQSVLDTLTGVYFTDVDMWYTMFAGSPIPTPAPAPGTPEAYNYNMFLDMALQIAGGMGQIVYNPLTVMTAAETNSLADKDLLAQRKADEILVPAPCREVIRLHFGIQRNVSYSANGATGTAPNDTATYLNGADVTLKAKGNLAKAGYTFIGWSPSAVVDITTLAQEMAIASTVKQPSETFIFTGNTTWHAVWAIDADGNEAPDYKQAIITYDHYAVNLFGFPKQQALAKGDTLVITDMEAKESDHILIGWHTTPLPVIASSLFENLIKKTPTFYNTGDLHHVTGDMTVYGVWAYDTNHNGIPDYLEQGGKALQSGAGTRSLMPDQNLSDNEIITDRRVWSYANTLHILSDKAVRANIYTLNGMLYKQLNLPAGMTSEPLERGMYVVEIEGSRYKVVIK